MMRRSQARSSLPQGWSQTVAWMRGRHKLGGSRYLFNPLHPIRAKWAGICNILLIFTVFMVSGGWMVVLVVIVVVVVVVVG